MNLPEPNFIERNPEKIKQEIIQFYEGRTGKTLQPAQQESIMAEVMAYRENLVRIAIQEAAKQNLLAYATFPMLDYIGQWFDVERLPEQSARTTLRFTISAQSFPVSYQAGTEIESKDGKVIFKTLENLTISAGNTTGEVIAEANIVGLIGNGYLAGDIKNPVSTLPYIVSVTNITTSSGGADEESDDSYRERIRLAPESFSNAGSKGAYIFHTKSAHQDIIDVTAKRADEPVALSYKIGATTYNATVNQSTGAITGTNITTGTVDFKTGAMHLIFSQAVSEFTATIPRGGTVNIYPLTQSGNPSSEIISAVENKLTDDKVRPLTDNVIVISPTAVDYTVVVNAVIEPEADLQTAKAQIESRVDEQIDKLNNTLGESIIPSTFIEKAQSVSGVKEVTLPSPAKTVLSSNQWARCTGRTVNVSY